MMTEVEEAPLESFYIAPSTLGESAGSGCFVSKPFPAGSVLRRYLGTRREASAVQDWSYCATVGLFEVLDAKEITTDNPMRYINDATGSPWGNNVRFRSDSESIWVVANREISAGEELFVEYGTDYWIRAMSFREGEEEEEDDHD